jgi:tetratricopeptide (TPR) repeat protein
MTSEPLPTTFDRLQSALRHHRAGERAAARQVYLDVLQAEPGNADAHHLLGLLALESAELPFAIEHLRAAVVASPMSAPVYYNLAVALLRAGERDAAIEELGEAARLEPSSAAIQNSLGAALRESGRAAEAERCLREAVRLDPNMALAYSNLGSALQDQGRFDAGIAEFSRARQLRPDMPEIHYNLATCYRDAGNGKEAMAAYRQAIALRPDFALAHQGLGLVLQSEKRYTEALASHQTARRYEGDTLENLTGEGVALQMLNRFDDAKACYQRALELDSGNVTAQYNLATALHTEGKPFEAERYYQAVLASDPLHADSLSALAMICMLHGNFVEASAYLERCLAIRPDSADGHFFHATMLLTQGKLSQGWPEFEYRTRCRFSPEERHYERPRWDGKPLEGRTLLVHPEYGYGDMMQFIRYDRFLRERVGTGKVLVAVHPNIIPLLSTSGFRDLVPQGPAIPPFDVQIAMMSLPGIFDTTLETIPADVPYLKADQDLVRKWRATLSSIEGFKVGIHWQGNAEYKGDMHRSMRLECFAPLAAVPGVTLISLQKGAGTKQIAELADRFKVIELDDFDERGGAFMDSAAVIENLDLVITSDSALAHLAGALAAPTWLVLSVASEWRWFRERDDSPWYPTMHLFRQRTLDDWADVFQRVAEALRQHVAAASR